MAMHAVIYTYVNDPARLDEHRPRHRDFLAGLFAQGRVVVSGPLNTGGPGALLILDGDDEEHVATMLDADPFRELGLIADRQIRGWSPFFGADKLTPTVVR